MKSLIITFANEKFIFFVWWGLEILRNQLISCTGADNKGDACVAEFGFFYIAEYASSVWLRCTKF